MATTPDPLEALFSLIPDAASNPVGTALHQAWVKLVEVSVPGRLPAVTRWAWTLLQRLLRHGQADCHIVLDPTAVCRWATCSAPGGGRPTPSSRRPSTTWRPPCGTRSTRRPWTPTWRRARPCGGGALASYVTVFGSPTRRSSPRPPARRAWQAYLPPHQLGLDHGQEGRVRRRELARPRLGALPPRRQAPALGAAQADVTAVLTDLAAGNCRCPTSRRPIGPPTPRSLPTRCSSGPTWPSTGARGCSTTPTTGESRGTWSIRGSPSGSSPTRRTGWRRRAVASPSRHGCCCPTARIGRCPR